MTQLHQLLYPEMEVDIVRSHPTCGKTSSLRTFVLADRLAIPRTNIVNIEPASIPLNFITTSNTDPRCSTIKTKLVTKIPTTTAINLTLLLACCSVCFDKLIGLIPIYELHDEIHGIIA